MPSDQVTTATALANILDQYNNGIIGPGHCAVDTVTASPVLYPNPSTINNSVNLHLPDLSGATDLNVKVFTVAYRKVTEKTYTQVQPGIDPAISLTDQTGRTLGNGLYYVDATYWNGPAGSGANLVHWTGKLLVLH